MVPTLTSIKPVTVAHAGPDATGAEGSAIALTGALSGADATPKWSVASGAPCTIVRARTLTPAITCTDNGTYEVTLTGGRSSDTLTVTVTNAAPVIRDATGPAKPVSVGAKITLTTHYTDPGRSDTLTCLVDWADGTAPTSCRAGHTYRKAGIYHPTVTVTDDDGAATSRPSPTWSSTTARPAGPWVAAPSPHRPAPTPRPPG